MVLAADQAGGAWQAGPRYSPLLALDAGSSWAVSEEPPQAPGYAPLLPAEADASWLGAQPYAALQPDSADAQWQQQTPAEPTGHAATGFQATKFGAPERWIAPPAKLVRAQGWQTGGFGIPDVPSQAAPITEGVQFGFPRATFHTDIGGGSEPIAVQARGWRSGSFGRPAAQAQLQVQAQGWQSAQFGQPVARQTVHAAAIAPATAFGTPVAQLQLQAQARGWQAARFGTPLVQRQGNAQGFAVTKFGTPTAGAAFGAQAQGFRAGTWGTPAMAVRVHALPIAPGTRFGRPTRTWSTEC